MEKQTLEHLIAENKSSYEIAAIVGNSATTVRYWLNKYELKTNKSQYNKNTKIIPDFKTCKTCKTCNEIRPIDDFHFRNKLINETRVTTCKICTNKVTMDRFRKNKLLFVAYKGNKCSICNYNKCPAALEFHHLDPTQKEFGISDSRNNTLNQKVKDELDKCILVCSNCHKEIHYDLDFTL